MKEFNLELAKADNMKYTTNEISAMKEELLQACQNPQVVENFKCFHKYIVDSIIAFCKVNKLTDIDIITLKIDNLNESLMYGEWKPWTDSSLTMFTKDSECPYLSNV